MSRLTDSQNRAVYLRGESILVSASAGTGKTHAIIERILGLIIGEKGIDRLGNSTSNKMERVSIDNMVLMTFTDASAKEMKSRLSNALIKYRKTLDGSDEDLIKFIDEQIDIVPLANICTIHSYCARLIRQYSHSIEISASFNIASEQELADYSVRALDNIFQDEALRDELNYLRDIFSAKNRDDKLEKLITKISKYALSKENCVNWLDKVKNRYSLYSWNELFIPIFNRIIEDFYQRVCDKNQVVEQNKNIINKGEELLNEARRLERYLDDMRCMSSQEFDSIIRFKSNVFERYTSTKDLMGIAKAYIKIINDLYEQTYLDKYWENPDFYQEILVANDEFSKIIVSISSTYLKLLQSYKLINNQLSYSDLETYMVELLANEIIADDIRDRNKYVFIDEYQDTSSIQNYIVKSISRSDNLYMVGDVKQCIYKFRNAKPQNFRDMYEEYAKKDAEGLNISFNHNFRSRPQILEYINRIFSDVMTIDFGKVDYKEQAQLESPDAIIDEMYSKENRYPAVSIITYEDSKTPILVEDDYDIISDLDDTPIERNLEAEIIYNQIKKLVGSKYCRIVDGTPVYDVIEYKDIAIITHKRNDAALAMVEELQRMGLDVDTSNFMKNDSKEAVELFINYLRIVDNSKQDISLIAIMRSFFGKFTDDELMVIRSLDYNISVPFYSLVHRIKGVIGEKVVTLFEQISKYRQKASYLSIFELASELIAESGYDKYLLAQENGEYMLAQLNVFLQSIRGKSYANSISSLLHYYDNCSEELAKVSAVQPNSIKVLTLHRVKGLEYPVIFFACNNNKFVSNKESYVLSDEGIAIKTFDKENRNIEKNWLFNIMNEYEKSEELEQNLYTFYVALTRAKNHLIITGKYIKNMKSPSFLKWAKQGINEDVFVLDAYMGEAMIEYQEKIDIVADYYKKPKPEYINALSNVLEYDYPHKLSTKIGIKYSVSEINRSVINIDEDRGESLWGEYSSKATLDNDMRKRGIATHKIMEHIDYNCNSLADVELELERLVFENILDNEEVLLVNAMEIATCLQSDIMKYARVNNTYREQNFIYKTTPEKLFGIDCKDEVLVQGVIDLIICGKENIIVDFKRTSVYDDSVIIEKYSKQLELYAEAARSIMGLEIHKKIIYLLKQGRSIIIT